MPMRPGENSDQFYDRLIREVQNSPRARREREAARRSALQYPDELRYGARVDTVPDADLLFFPAKLPEPPQEQKPRQGSFAFMDEIAPSH